MKIVLVTGGFDPLHSGHIEYFKEAKKLGDKLIVGLNSDSWLERKKGRAFMPGYERSAIIENLNMVDGVILFNDDDNTATEAIKNVQQLYPNDQIIFANGGDRNARNIPEMLIPDVLFKFGVGGTNKANSSSWILDEWKAPKTERPWGYYRVLHEVPGMKVKELTINPGQKLSMQRHRSRAEYWIVSEGTAVLNSMMPGGYSLPSLKLLPHASYTIPEQCWHQLTNPFDEPCKIVEVQYGESCTEDDIERKD
jgi:cytidyltransferase-like protein